MNPAATVLSTAGGVGVIGLALLDAFATFFSHVERGALSHTLVRAMWSTCHRLPGTGALRLAGPVSVLIVLASWVVMLTLGWALVYLPWMPEGFLHTADLDAPGSSLLDSLYFSLVTLATLGYGDIAPLSGWLRVVAPLESLLGLGLLAGSVSWLLSIFPVLSRRRALAYEIHLLEEVRTDPGKPGPPAPLPASVCADLTSRLVASERDLVTFPITYYLHDDDIRFALPAAMEHLVELAEEARRQASLPEVHFHGRLLLRAIDDFAASLAERFHLPNRSSTRQVLEAYARDHRRGAG
jgi:voltage-gated potassium channel Kch